MGINMPAAGLVRHRTPLPLAAAGVAPPHARIHCGGRHAALALNTGCTTRSQPRLRAQLLEQGAGRCCGALLGLGCLNRDAITAHRTL